MSKKSRQSKKSIVLSKREIRAFDFLCGRLPGKTMIIYYNLPTFYGKFNDIPFFEYDRKYLYNYFKKRLGLK